MDGKLDFPAFSSIDLDSVEAKLDALIAAGNQKIAALETVSEPDWEKFIYELDLITDCLLYTSPSPRDRTRSRMPSSA